MITVAILINGNVLKARSAVNTTPEHVKIKDETICTYEVDDGTILKHRYGDGAVKLAKMMLDTFKGSGME